MIRFSASDTNPRSHCLCIGADGRVCWRRSRDYYDGDGSILGGGVPDLGGARGRLCRCRLAARVCTIWTGIFADGNDGAGGDGADGGIGDWRVGLSGIEGLNFSAFGLGIPPSFSVAIDFGVTLLISLTRVVAILALFLEGSI